MLLPLTWKAPGPVMVREPTCPAMSAMTPQIDRAYQIADHFRAAGKKVVIGGFHASFAPEEVLEHADAAAVGEAENIWPRIIEDFRRGKMEGIYRSEGHPDFSNLPSPRYDLLRRMGYALRTSPIQTTRGCPKRCEFCSVHQFFGGRFLEDIGFGSGTERF